VTDIPLKYWCPLAIIHNITTPTPKKKNNSFENMGKHMFL
jgi:hypothetical protein